MALLEDPTIQRILDEVNKAATGGVFGAAGNYISEPDKMMQPPKNDYYTQQQEAPLFYPSPDMFNIDGITNFDQNLDLNVMESMVPIATPNNFDLYSAGLYNTMPQNLMSPYEQHKPNNIPLRPMSTVSSINNDVLLEQQQQQQQQQQQHHHRHEEYPTVPPHVSSAIPNLGLNLRSSPPMDSVPVNLPDVNDEMVASNDPIDTATASMDLLVDKDDSQSLSVNNNEEMDPPHISSAGRIFYDPNPQIVQRKGANSVTYKQNIIVRYLQPPPIPNAGPLIIKEICSQQQPPLPPLVIKQRPTPPKTPPPLIIREKPPPLPASLATKVITRHLPPEPAPPRAVIIERLPPLPPKPRDIIIERWLPYEIVNQKRKVVVERVQKSTKEFAPPKNVIITYEPIHAKVERHFQKQGVVREDPQAYVNRFGEQLCEPIAVIQQARAAGVLEDLNPPTTFFPAATQNVEIDAEYEPTRGMDEPESMKINEQEEIMTSSVENVPEEDVLVEENVTPFFMNSGENFQQTLHRLGIEIPPEILKDHQL